MKSKEENPVTSENYFVRVRQDFMMASPKAPIITIAWCVCRMMEAGVGVCKLVMYERGATVHVVFEYLHYVYNPFKRVNALKRKYADDLSVSLFNFL